MIPEKESTEFNASVTQLTQAAIRFGATDAAVISSGDIRADDDLAAMCNGGYTCPSYGLAASCPPHVEGPEQFRKWQEKSRYAITVKIELPASVMFSDKRKDVMRLLHQVVAGVEKMAVELGFSRSRAFAGGSCKPLFCEENNTCCVVTDKHPCRHGSVIVLDECGGADDSGKQQQEHARKLHRKYIAKEFIHMYYSKRTLFKKIQNYLK